MLSATGIRELVRSTKTYQRWRNLQRSIKTYIEQSRPAAYSSAFSEDPLTRRGLDSLEHSTQGVKFRWETDRIGAWQVEIDVEYNPTDSTEDAYLSWRLDSDPLATPMGAEYYSVHLKPGRHAYTSYISLRQKVATGNLVLETATGDGWNVETANEQPVIDERGSTNSAECKIRDVKFRAPTRDAEGISNYVLLPITNYCNFKCVMCEHGIDAVPNKAHYPEPLADLMIEFLNGASQSYRVALTGLGESLMSPMFYHVVDEVRNPLVRFHFCSNAAMLTDERIDWILKSPFSYINVSLDAATGETFFKIRRANWKIVMANLERFVTALENSGRSDLRLILNMTLMKENFHELKPFIDLTKRLNATAYVNQLHSYGMHESWVVDHPDFRFSYQDQVLRSGEQTRQGLADACTYARREQVPFRADDLMRPLLDEETNSVTGEVAAESSEEVAPISMCPYPWVGDDASTAVINADGGVGMCCLQEPIGHVNAETSLNQVWNGPVARNVRRDIIEGRIPQPCSNANCWFVARQRALNGMSTAPLAKNPLPIIDQPDDVRRAG